MVDPRLEWPLARGAEGQELEVISIFRPELVPDSLDDLKEAGSASGISHSPVSSS